MAKRRPTAEQIISKLALVVRFLTLVVLTFAALTTVAVWGYNSWPSTPSRFTFMSGILPRIQFARYSAPRSEWYIMSGQFVVRRRFLVDQAFRCTNTWEAGRFYFKIDVYIPRDSLRTPDRADRTRGTSGDLAIEQGRLGGCGLPLPSVGACNHSRRLSDTRNCT